MVSELWERERAHICERGEVPGQRWGSLYPDALIHQLLLVEPGPGIGTERERIVVLPSGVLGFRLTGCAQAGLGAEYGGTAVTQITVTVAFGTDLDCLIYPPTSHLGPVCAPGLWHVLFSQSIILTYTQGRES